MFKDKTVVIGVTGSIAAYKSAALVSALVKQRANVEVIMTKNATNFINPITFETLTGNKCLTDTFDRNFQFQVEHVSLAKRADLFMVAPASANVIGKIANGIADDMLTTTFMACTCKKMIAPAMNTNMYLNPIVQDNMQKLEKYGIEVISPANGHLACGDNGVGKLPEPEVLFSYVERELLCEKDLLGKKILVTAGPTCEAIDPVRYITNHSTGKMGYAIAKMAMLRGADVTLVSGPCSIKLPMFINTIMVESAAQMYDAVMKEADVADGIIMSAAVADYTPVTMATEKVKKQEHEWNIPLKRTKDILEELGKRKKEHQFICGFAMETKDLLENAQKKLIKKNADMIVANSLRTEGAGFGCDTNVATFVKKDGKVELPMMSKEKLANLILDEILGADN